MKLERTEVQDQLHVLSTVRHERIMTQMTTLTEKLHQLLSEQSIFDAHEQSTIILDDMRALIQQYNADLDEQALSEWLKAHDAHRLANIEVDVVRQRGERLQVAAQRLRAAVTSGQHEELDEGDGTPPTATVRAEAIVSILVDETAQSFKAKRLTERERRKQYRDLLGSAALAEAVAQYARALRVKQRISARVPPQTDDSPSSH